MRGAAGTTRLMTVPTAALTHKRRRRSARHATPSPRPHRATSADAITPRDTEGQGERARIRLICTGIRSMPIGTWFAHVWRFGAALSMGPSEASQGTPGGLVRAEKRLGAFG